MTKNIAVIRGDGIGPEIVEQAIKVLQNIALRYDHRFVFTEVCMGGCAVDRFGTPLPQESIDCCLAADAVLLGAVGGPKWDGQPKEKRPEKGLLGIRAAMGLYANLRPAKLFPQLADASPLKPALVQEGIDLLMVRELIGGIYFGSHCTQVTDGQKTATDLMTYSESEIVRIAHVAFQAARKRRSKVTSVDKANVLDTSKLWREVLHRVSGEYPDVAYSDLLVDNAAMQLVKQPSQFDVVVTENMFGDILSDEASMITGSIGMIGSASLGDGTRGLYEPIHGSAPDIAGSDLANPIGTILSAAMLLAYSFGLQEESRRIEWAVGQVLDQGYRTADTMRAGNRQVGCVQMGDLIAAQIL